MATLAEDLRAASKKEKDPRVMLRIAAVNAVCVHGEDVGSTAKLLMRTPNCIRQWVSRFEEGGALMPPGITPAAEGRPR